VLEVHGRTLQFQRSNAMAQVFPSDRDDVGSAASVTLAWTLRTLPDPWTLLRDRRIDASGELIDLIVVHPEIGVALIDEAPRDPAAGVAALRDFLERERFADFFPGTLPIVSLSVAIDEFPTLDQKLTRAFDASLVLSIEDRDWADVLIELMSQSAGMATADDAVRVEALRAPTLIPDFAGPRESLASDVGPTPYAMGKPAAAAVGRTAGVGHLFITRRRYATPAALALSAASVLVAAVVALAMHGSAAPNDAIRPRVEAAALVVPPATPRAAASLPHLSAAVRHPRRPAVRRVRCADWLHQNRPGGSDYHGPPVAGCRDRH
jgi:hypothetical protein